MNDLGETACGAGGAEGADVINSQAKGPDQDESLESESTEEEKSFRYQDRAHG